MRRREPSRLLYQAQESSLTLREGLAEYLAANPGLLDPNQTSTEAIGSHLQNHDVSHVVFGTTTSLRDEMLQDTWTFLATDVSARRYVGDFVKEEEGKELMKAALQWGAISAAIWLVGNLPRLVWCASRMSRKWPWDGWEHYLDSPLADIRREFGIRVL